MRDFLRRVWKVLSFPFRLLWRLLTLPARAVRRAWRFLTAEPEDRPLADAFAAAVQNPSALGNHIEALRRHLLRMVIALVVGVLLCAAFTPQILEFLAAPIGGLKELQALDPTESIGVFMKAALFSGFAASLPWLAFELWLFAAPGLTRGERWAGLAGIPLALAFFLGGLAFTYWVLLPAALPFLRDFLGVAAHWRLSTYMNFVTGLMFWIGVSFEFPLIVYALTRVRILRPQGLASQWRMAVIVIAVLAAAITPTADPLNMSLVMLPMLLLYLVSIGFSYLAVAGMKKDPVEEESLSK